MVIDAVTSSICASHCPGKKFQPRSSKVYFTIWCDSGTTQRVTRDALFISRINSVSRLASAALRSRGSRARPRSARRSSRLEGVKSWVG